MAKKLVAPNHRPIRGVALLVSLSLLLLAPLLVPGGDLAIAAKSNSFSLTNQTFEPEVPPVLSSDRHYEPQPAPLPGEIIVRFKPAYVGLLYQALISANALNPDFQESLIGASLNADQLYKALPELAAFFQHYQVWAANAIMPESGAYLLKLTQTFEPRTTALEMADSRFFDYTEANFPVYAFREPNDPLFRSQQTGLRQINAPEAWDITTGSDNIVIAIIDSGILARHPDLSGKVLIGMNYSVEPANSNTSDNNGHGTFVAGIAAANTNNNIGMAGVAWGARLLPIKVLDADGVGTNAAIAQGIAYATQRRAQIINISLGGPERSRVVEEATRAASGLGAVLIASVGNSGSNLPTYPAAFGDVIGVGAFDQRGEAASFSNYGPELSLSAPGSNVLGLWSGSPAYVYDSGTSSAAPFVSGAVALMLSVNPKLGSTQVRNILEGTADSSKPNDPNFPLSGNNGVRANSLSATYDTRLGWGRLNLLKAVQAAQRGEAFPAQRGRISGTIIGIDPLDLTLTLQPGDSRTPESLSKTSGLYYFEDLPPGNYTLKLESKKYGLVFAPQPFQIRGYEGEAYVRDYDLSLEVQRAFASGQPVGAFKPLTGPGLPLNPNRRFFSDTNHLVKDKFLKFWQDNGGLPVFGFPISEEFQEGSISDKRSYTVQYFERVVFEYHAEFAGTKDEIKLRRLGSEKAEGRSEREFEPTLPPALQLISEKPLYFYETRHSLRGAFLEYWRAKGGVTIFGYPVSEELNEEGRHVQYFERYRLEINPDPTVAGSPWEIVGSLLARDLASSKGLLGRP